MKGHEKDTLNTATISFPRLNNENEDNPYNFATPSTILMVQKDSLQSFFERASWLTIVLLIRQATAVPAPTRMPIHSRISPTWFLPCIRTRAREKTGIK